MLVNIRSRITAFFAAVLHLVMVCFVTVPGIATAQAVDIDPPVIEFEAITIGNIGDNQAFGATVLDNVGVSSVKLYYRFSDATAYRSQSMTMLGSSGIFTATIQSSDIPVGTSYIQYYLEALDEIGNRSLEGFAFDPIERELVSSQLAVAEPTAEPVAATGLSTNQKIIYGALGLLLLGVLASASGGGSSSSPGVPVTVVVDQIP